MRRFHLTASYSTLARSASEAEAIFRQALRDTPGALEIECETDPAPDDGAADLYGSDNLPEAYGFRVDYFRAFEMMAPPGLISRARLLDPSGGAWVLWDPQDGTKGFLLVDYDSGVLREEFADYARAHFDPPAPESFPPGTFAPV